MLQKLSAGPHHEGFLLKLYVSTRIDEVRGWGWDDTTRENFLKMQWNAQSRHYANEYPDAVHCVVRYNGQLVGRLMTRHTDLDILLIDVSILPECRNKGLGTFLIAELQAEAQRTGKSLQLSVLKVSPAVHLYQRLGFETIQANDLYCSMKWPVASNFQ